MGKTRDKNNLGVSLTNSKKQVKLTRSQKSKMAAAKVLGHSSVTDQSNLNEVIDKLDYITMTSQPVAENPDRDDASDEYEDLSSNEEGENAAELEDDDLEVECSGTNVATAGDACLVFRDPNTEGPILKMERELAKKELEDKQGFLVIPRRPKWTSDMKPEQLTLLESQSFAEWKYRISQTVQTLIHCSSTPFERNLDFWRQLWRVVERSDIVAQIVDARNPLLFFTEDLYRYCSEFEHPKKFFLLINKADFLSPQTRKQWVNYFSGRKIDYRFFCALQSTNVDSDVSKIQLEDDSVLSGRQLIDYIKSIKLDYQMNDIFRTCGFIGYPNVGKSSTINHLVGASKTSTSATPGKTKHFQTVFIDSELCLCDCPGLVMPNFVRSKADLLTNGILPIDQATELVSPINLIGQQVGWEKLCDHYGFSVEKLCPIGAQSFLEQFALTRGFGTARGNPDVSRSAKHVLKDFVVGKLVYCHVPPLNENQTSQHPSLELTSQLVTFEEKMPPMKSNEGLEARIDSQFFASLKGAAHLKKGSSALDYDRSEEGRLLKKHHKRGKKEKLRRVYKDLDAY